MVAIHINFYQIFKTQIMATFFSNTPEPLILSA
jgi:hypothetical protein